MNKKILVFNFFWLAASLSYAEKSPVSSLIISNTSSYNLLYKIDLENSTSDASSLNELSVGEKIEIPIDNFPAMIEVSASPPPPYDKYKSFSHYSNYPCYIDQKKFAEGYNVIKIRDSKLFNITHMTGILKDKADYAIRCEQNKK